MDRGQAAAVMLGDARALVAEAMALLAESSLSESSLAGSSDGSSAGRSGTPAVQAIKVRRGALDPSPIGHGDARAGPRRHAGPRTISVVVFAGAGFGLIAAAGGTWLSNHSNRPVHAQTVSAGLVSPPVAPPTTGGSTTVVPAAPLPEADTAVPQSVEVARLHASATVSGPVVVQPSGPEEGLLSAPADYHDLGWYRNDNTGALVIDGHVGFRQSPGPLAYIGELVAGDTVQVAFPQDVRDFTVTLVGRAVKGQLPPEYFSPQYNGQVMLITCDYTSSFHAGHYADNVYVLAAPA